MYFYNLKVKLLLLSFNILLNNYAHSSEIRYLHLMRWPNLKNFLGPCTRCNIISINQVNSERVQEPLQYLAKNETRRFKFGVLAGSNISMEGLNVTIGDEISIE